MSWKSPIKALDIRRMEELDADDLLEGDHLSFETLLIKWKGKVIACCTLKLIDRSGVVMCSYETFSYGLIVRKIRRPNIFKRYINREPRVGTIIKEMRDIRFV